MADEKKIITSDVLNSYGSAIKTYVDAKDNSLQSQLDGIKTTVDNIGEHTKVIDNLTSEETTKALSAKQGKILKDLVDHKYTKPSNGIPKDHLEIEVQLSLDKADKAVQPSQISDMETRTHASETYQTKGNYIVEGDSRLTDSRTPKAHTHPQSDITNLTTDLQNIREVAEGKTKTYVASHFFGDADTPNKIFYSNNNIVLTNSSFIIIRRDNALNENISEDDYLYLDNLKIGDVILIPEIDVPDRWYGGKTGINHMFYKMETAKIDLDPYATKEEVALKEDKSNLKALAYKDSLTASDVGARPDTWIPTAAQVGAYTKTEVDNAIANATPNITYATASDLADIWKN